MLFLAHRGWWTVPSEKNTREAFERAFRQGYGIETDLRDHNGHVVISHDPPTGADLMTFADLLVLHAECKGGPLALNIKADGLQSSVMNTLAAYPQVDYFVFDMAVPDALGYLRSGARTYTRQSEYEREPSFYGRAAGVWLDAFDGDWIGPEVIEPHLAAGKQVALVSPELHGRDPLPAWTAWRDLVRQAPAAALQLCTDYPDRAQEFFA